MGVHTAGFKDQSSLQREEEEGDFHLLLQVSCLLCHSLCSLPFFHTSEPLDFTKSDLSLILKFLFPVTLYVSVPSLFVILCEFFEFPPICTQQTGSGNLENPCWDPITSRHVWRKNPTLNLGTLHSSSSVFISFSIKQYYPLSPSWQLTGVYASPSSASLFTFFHTSILIMKTLDKWHLERWLGVRVSQLLQTVFFN